MHVETGIKLDFKDVLLKPKRSILSSRKEVDIERQFTFLHSKFTWKGVPIVTSNMDTTGTFEMYYSLSKFKMITCFHKHYEIDDYPEDLDPNYYSLSTGISDNDWTKIQLLISKLNPHFLTIDVANGYNQKFIDFCKKVRDTYPNLTLIVGNVVTADMVQELLISAKVDIIKVGIGSGSVCSTRLKTGVGMPQLSAIAECCEAANGIGGHIMSDGGCSIPSDICKAFCAGAHFVMLGGMFSGHEESGGDLIVSDDGKKYKLYYGMSSEYAQKKHNGGLKSYRSSEGKIRKIPYKGKVENTLLDILGGLRSCGTYIGAQKLKYFSKCATFVRVNRQVNEVYSDKMFMV